MDAVQSIWDNLKRQMTSRNLNLTQDELQEDFDLISSNAKFITGLSIQGQKFTVSVQGQAIGLEIFFDPLLRVWKAALRDALENPILDDITLLAGVNCVRGMSLSYRATNDAGSVVEEDLAMKGLFVTEPYNSKFDKFEQGVESSKYAFVRDRMGNSACALLYFTDQDAADVYMKLINGEQGWEFINLDDLNYEVKTGVTGPEDELYYYPNFEMIGKLADGLIRIRKSTLVMQVYSDYDWLTIPVPYNYVVQVLADNDFTTVPDVETMIQNVMG